MSTTKRIVWDEEGKRLFEVGLDRGVLYPKNTAGAGYMTGVGWDGLTKVDESPEGGDTTTKYANNGVYLKIPNNVQFKGSISAYTYPKEWEKCDGTAGLETTGVGGVGPKVPVKGLKATGQTRSPFGLSYRTLIGNDLEGIDYAYQLHLVYNATAAVSSKSRETINENVDPSEMSWNFDTTPVTVPGLKKTAHIYIDSREADPTQLAKLETILYGSESAAARLPLPEEVITILGGVGG